MFQDSAFQVFLCLRLLHCIGYVCVNHFDVFKDLSWPIELILAESHIEFNENLKKKLIKNVGFSIVQFSD